MSRPLTLLIYNSPLFPAHWALWLPSLSNPNIGKLPNAVGSASQGFEVVIEREHDVSGITQRYQIVPLGLVSEDCVCDGDAEGGGGGAGSRDKGVCDVERVALGVCAPGVSLRGDGDEGLEGPRRRVRIQNCQTWVREVVVKLVEEGVVGQEVLGIVDGAPKNQGS